MQTVTFGFEYLHSRPGESSLSGRQFSRLLPPLLFPVDDGYLSSAPRQIIHHSKEAFDPV